MRRGVRIATAEALTAGSIAAALGAAPDASTWFCGGIVAYESEAKFSLLGVERGPVITDACARQMAVGAAHLFGSDVAVSATGAGGPGSQEGQRAGTVFLGVRFRDHVIVQQQWFAGAPATVVHRSVEAALELLVSVMDES